MEFNHQSRRVSVRVPVVIVDRYSVGALYLFHAAIAAALFGSALLVLVAASNSASARAYSVVGFTGAVFLTLLLDYHLLGRGAPVFVLFFAATSSALFNFARVYPEHADSDALQGVLLVASFLVLGLGCAGFTLAIFGRMNYWVIVGISISNAVALATLTLRLLVAFARANSVRRTQLRSSIAGIAALSCALLFTQLFAWLPSVRILHLMAPVSGMMMLLAIAHGLLKHNVFDAKTIVSTSRLTTPLVALSLAAFLATAAVIEFSSGHTTLSPAVLVVAAAPIGWTAFAKLRTALDSLIFASATLFRPLVAALAQRITAANSRQSVVLAVEGALLESKVYASVRVQAVESLTESQQRTLRRGEFVELELEDMAQGLVIPMVASGDLRAILVLIPRRDRLLSSDDILLAVTAATLGALALHHLDVLAERDAMRLAERSADQLDKATSLGTLASEVLHELQAPLHFLKSFMSGAFSPHSLHSDLLELARDETARLERLVIAARRMRPPELALSWQSLADAVGVAHRIVEGLLPARQIPIQITVDRHIHVLADRDRLIQVFVNLLRNAAEAAAPDTAIGVSSQIAPTVGDALVVDVWDDGPGVDERIEAQLFQAFRSTRPNGMGLGLVVCARVVQELGWEIQYLRSHARTRFRLSIPASAAVTRSADSVC
ncbi:MAG: HAMP domain-containing histidine kinase [Myxococcales bacterium]|nr:HAMP domain-containing histidine kinase [Myxococcales bacterium]